MAKYAAKGTTISIDAVTIANVRSVGEATGGDRERIDVTTHDTVGVNREYVLGFKGEESFSFTIAWDPAHASHDSLVALLTAGTSEAVVITYPTTPAATASFNGRVTAMSLPAADIDGALIRTVTITIDGAITEA